MRALRLDSFGGEVEDVEATLPAVFVLLGALSVVDGELGHGGSVVSAWGRVKWRGGSRCASG